MQNTTFSGLCDLISIISAASKDKSYSETVKKMHKTFQELILAEANARRNKIDSLIRTMAKIDSEIFRFKYEYARISNQLTPEAISKINKFLRDYEQKKKDIIFEKNRLKTKNIN